MRVMKKPPAERRAFAPGGSKTAAIRTPSRKKKDPMSTIVERSAWPIISRIASMDAPWRAACVPKPCRELRSAEDRPRTVFGGFATRTG
jgi:hypothetical protein